MTTSPRQSAPDGDVAYLLRDLDRSPLRFRIKKAAGATPLDPIESALQEAIAGHAGATIPELVTSARGLAQWDYAVVRDAAARLYDRRMVETTGCAPLESVDARYERVPACDICGSDSASHRTLFWKYGTPVVRCSSCAFVYANPRWTQQHLFSRFTEDYWRHYLETSKFSEADVPALSAHYSDRLAIIAPARSTGRLLDVGCATGEFLTAASAAGWRVFGVETSKLAAERARTASKAEMHVGVLATAPFESASFDVVTLWDVIEHVPSPRSVLADAFRLLHPGGILAMTTPNIRSVSYFRQGRDWWVVGPNEHISYFTPATMRLLLTKLGFGSVHIETLDEPAPSGDAKGVFYKVLRQVGRRFLLGDELSIVAVKPVRRHANPLHADAGQRA